MFPISQRMSDALRTGYRSKVTADVYFAGSYQTTLPIVDGEVVVDRTAKNHRTCTLTIGDPGFVPQYVNSPLAPYGAELRVFQGISYMAGDFEQIPLGVFRIQDVDWEESAGSLPVVQGLDRSQAIDDAKFLVPFDGSGLSAQFLIRKLVTDVLDVDVLFDVSLVDYTLPGGSLFDSSRTDAINTAASGMGAEAYFDVFGAFVVVPVPSITQSTSQSDAVWTVDAGPKGVLVKAKRGVSRTGVYNAVAAQGVSADGTGTPPVGFAVDTDPRSPTYFGAASTVPFGPFERTSFGQSVYKYTNSLMTNATQCSVAAKAQLANLLGLARSLDFTMAPNPALAEGDLILVKYLSGQSELHLVDTLRIPLGSSGQFSGTTRTLTYQSTGGT